MVLAEGRVFAGYRIVRLLGSGGMGEVYLAEHPRLPRRDALKVLPEAMTADGDFRERFHREADLAATLWHPNIVGVHDRGEFDGQLWISMDYVDGIDAGQLIRNQYPAGMSPDNVLAIVTEVAGALDYAHQRGLLHRDVKPANILLTHAEQGERRILLADFGIARQLGDISGLTVTNMTVGTVAYSAPEQLMGADIDGRGDQYALAATAYHLLTGSQLFPHSNPVAVISRHLTAAPPALADTRGELASLDIVLSAALAKDPAKRFDRCVDFARALAEQITSTGAVLAAPTTPAPVSSATPKKSSAQGDPSLTADRGRSRRRWMIPIAAAIVVILVAAVAGLWQPWEDRRSQPTVTSSSSPPPETSAAPNSITSAPQVFPAAEIDTVLLTPAEISTLVGGPSDPLMVIDQTTHGMLDNANLVTPPECVGVVFTGERHVFANTGLVAMQDETLEPPRGAYNIRVDTVGPKHVEQAVVIYPTSEQAGTILGSSQRQWQSCASGQVRLGTVGQNGENGLTFDLGGVQLRNGVLTLPMVANSQESGGSACQQALAVRANVVVGVRSCRDPKPPPGELNADVSSVRNDADQLATAMIDKVTV